MNNVDKKKRGRKSTNKIINDNCITYDNNNIDTNYIAFLPLAYEDINNIVTYVNNESSEKNVNNNELIINKNKKYEILDNINKLDIKINNINNLYNYDDYINNNLKINCWWCHYLIDCKIFGIPEKMILPNIFYVNGFYCSLNCCISHCFDNNNDKKLWEKISLIYMMKDILFSNYINNKEYINDEKISKIIYDEIIPAKNKYILNIFGGTESYEEYRKNFITINDKNELVILLHNEEIDKNINKNDYKLKRQKNKKNNILQNILNIK